MPNPLDLSAQLGSPWIGFGMALAGLIGLLLIIIGYISGMSQYGMKVHPRVRVPVIALGFVYLWRAYAIFSSKVLTGAGLLVFACTAFTLLLVLIEVILRANARYTMAKAEQTVLDALSPIPTGIYDPMKDFKPPGDGTTK